MQIKRTSSSGLSLIELMVAIAVGMILITIVVSIFVSNKQAYSFNNRMIELTENVNFSMQMISNDLANAGFYGTVNYKDTIIRGTGLDQDDSMAADCAGNASAVSLSTPVFGTDLATDVGCLTNVTANTAILSVKSVVARTVVDDDLDDNIYLRTGFNKGGLFLGPNIPTSIENISRSNDMNWEFNNHIYFISNNRLMLAKLENNSGSASWQVQTLVGGTNTDQDGGIENMQILYGVDTFNADAALPAGRKTPWNSTDGLGIPNYFVNAAQVTDWNQVVAVKIFILARSSLNPHYTDTKSYQLGNVTINAANDNFHRKVFTNTVFLRNQWFIITGKI